MRRLGYVVGVCSVAVGAFCLTQPVGPAQAEMYVAGQVGWTIPNDATNIESTGSFAGIKFSDLDLQNSFMYGAKLGDRKSTRLNSSHPRLSRMPSSA